MLWPNRLGRKLIDQPIGWHLKGRRFWRPFWSVSPIRDCPDRFAPRGIQVKCTTIVPCGPFLPVCDGQRPRQIKAYMEHCSIGWWFLSEGRKASWSPRARAPWMPTMCLWLWWLQRLIDFKVEDFNLHASPKSTTAAEKILAVDVHHHTRPHGWPRILVILPGIVHFFNGEEIEFEVHHDGQRNHHLGELESDQQKRTLRASLVPSYFSPLIVAARIDREVQIAGHRSCWGCRRSRRCAAILFLTRSIRIPLRHTR